MRRYTEGGVNLSRVRQAKLSRAEEWSDKWRTKEEVRGGLAGGEEKMRKETGGDGGGRRWGETPRVPSV